MKAFLVSIQFTQCKIDPCVYVRNEENGLKFTAVYVHVDDLGVTGNDIRTFKEEISSRWEMDDLGMASIVVGIEINRMDTHTYSISQGKYAKAILSRFNMLNSKPAATPLPPGLKLYQSTVDDLKKVKGVNLHYGNVVGSLMYLAQCTRPDLAHVVGVLSQHLENPVGTTY